MTGGYAASNRLIDPFQRNGRKRSIKGYIMTHQEVQELSTRQLDTLFKGTKRSLIDLHKKYDRLESDLDRKRKTGRGSPISKIEKQKADVVQKIWQVRQTNILVMDERDRRRLRENTIPITQLHKRINRRHSDSNPYLTT